MPRRSSPLRSAAYRLLLAALLCLLPAAGCAGDSTPDGPKRALPGYVWSFPRDHGAHNDYATEWWYYTGHLDAQDGRTFGFELTFFRTRVAREEEDAADESNDAASDASTNDASNATSARAADSAFAVEQMHWAHFAISDLGAKKFHFDERLNRGGVGVAGAREDMLNAWNGKWSVEALGDIHHLRAELRGDDGVERAIRLALVPRKPLALHGDNGYSQKAGEVGNASMYYSFTNLDVQGTLYLDDQPLAVTGDAWMDHEFGTSQLADDQVGWDWFALNLDDGSELMLYGLRHADGAFGAWSGGTFVAKDGATTRLKRDDFAIAGDGTWTSPHTKGIYPQGWTLTVKPLALKLDVAANLADQELRTKLAGEVDYWEGSVAVSGTRDGAPVKGRGYVELVGYSRPFDGEI